MKSQQEAEMRVHKTLELTDSCDIEDRTPSRPDVHVWHDAEDPDCEEGRSITIKVGGAFGAQTRVADFAYADPSLKTFTNLSDFAGDTNEHA
jgi:hypothetical protein